jgi:hypothetical protein
MRFVWLIALFSCCIAFASLDAVAQEGQKEGDSAEAGEESLTEEEIAAREAFRRSRMGNIAQLDVGDKTIAISYGNTPADGPDYPKVETTKDGATVKLTKSIVTKLKTDLNLTFGDVGIKTGNVAENYPGVYGLWLKRVGDGWHLVFSEYADVWGTQHFEEGDVAEIPLTYAKAAEAAEHYTVNVDEADGGGTIRITWGDHEWAATFTVVQ